MSQSPTALPFLEAVQMHASRLVTGSSQIVNGGWAAQ